MTVDPLLAARLNTVPMRGLDKQTGLRFAAQATAVGYVAAVADPPVYFAIVRLVKRPLHDPTPEPERHRPWWRRWRWWWDDPT